MALFMNLLITGFIILLTYWVTNHYKKRRFWKLLDQFYGGKTYPLLGNAHLFKNSEDFLWKTYELSKKAGHTTYKIILGSAAYVILCDPDTIEVLMSNNKEITKAQDYNYFQEWLGDGLLISGGNKWRVRRKIITPTFHFKILEQYVKVFNDNGKVLLEQLSKHKGKVTDIYPFINAYALDVICEAAMGVSVNAQIDSDSEYIKSIHSICKLIKGRTFSTFQTIPWYYRITLNHDTYYNSLKNVHNMTNNVIKTRKELLKDQIEKVRNGGTIDDQDEFIKIRKKIAFLDLLLLSKLPDGSFLSDEDVREETDTFMFEGHDTTTSAISFALYSLANNPDVQKKALEEVKDVLGDDPNTDITYEHLQNMKYMDMVIKETLRLYPSVPAFGRELQNDLTLPDGKIVPAGCRLFVDTFALGRNPRHFPDYEKFNPERFSPENTAGKNAYSFVSFSAGSRNCIGQKFAMLELKSILAKVLLNYELVSGGDGAQLRLASEIILKTVTGVRIIIKDRKKP